MRKVIAEPKELIRIMKSNDLKYLRDYRSFGIQSKFLPQVIKTEAKNMIGVEENVDG